MASSAIEPPPVTSSGKLWMLLNSGSPIVLVYYESIPDLERLLQEATLYSPEPDKVFRTNDVDAAILHPTDIVLLTPGDPAMALKNLYGRRDALVDRELPVVLFIQLDSDASK